MLLCCFSGIYDINGRFHSAPGLYLKYTVLLGKIKNKMRAINVKCVFKCESFQILFVPLWRMKVTSATIRLCLKKSRASKSGEFPVYLVVCYHGRVEKSTGISCAIQYWDCRRECVKAKCPNAPVLNKMLNDLKQRVIEARTRLEIEGRGYTAQMLIESASQPKEMGKNDYRGVYMRLIDERRLKSGTVRKYEYVYRKLCEYLKRKSFMVDELTLPVVKDFCAWMERDGIKTNSIKSILCCVASVWNYAISRKIADKDGYPFDEFKYTQKYREIPRDYYLEESHIIRLKEYFLNMVIEREGRRWHYKDGAEERLNNRCSAEFGILFFLLCYKYGGAAPVDVALLRPSDFSRESVNGVDYWKLDFDRRKTGRHVTYVIKRDVFVIVSLEYYMGRCGHFLYPIINWYEGCSDKFMLEQSHKCAVRAISAVREAFLAINSDIARDNATEHKNEPLVDVTRLVMYTARHSRASNYFNQPGATIGKLATMLGRSSNTIATYAHMIKRNEELAGIDDDCAI